MCLKQNIEKMNRLNDVFFKYTLGSTERKNWTLNFLNITLDLKGNQQFKDISFSDKDLLPQELDEKLSILDILATANDGTIVNIEVQVCKDKFMADRSLYYWSRILGGQLHKKDTYDQLNKVISLILLDFDFFTKDKSKNYEGEYHQSYHIRDDKHLNDILSPQLEMHFIELEKLHYSDIKNLKRSDRWIAYLSKRVSDADRKELAEMEPVIKEALEHKQIFMHNPTLRREYEAREKATRDEMSRIKTAKEEVTIEVINKGLKMGLDFKMIAELVSVPISKVEELAKTYHP